jgi:RHS repeat-associated protein
MVAITYSDADMPGRNNCSLEPHSGGVKETLNICCIGTSEETDPPVGDPIGGGPPCPERPFPDQDGYMPCIGIQGRTLTYWSRGQMNRMTGNWWFPFDIFVVPQANGDIKYYEPGVPGLLYVWDAINLVYVSPQGRYDTLVQNADMTWTRTTKFGIKYHFNTAGFLDTIRDSHNVGTTIARDAMNRMTTISYWTGRSWTLAYNAAGYLGTLTDSSGRATSFGYDALGNLTSIAYPSATYFDRATSQTVTRSPTLTMQYITGTGTSLDGNLTAIIDDRGSTITSIQYDAQDRAMAQTHRGGTWTYQYGATTRVTDPDGITSDFHFDASGRISRKDVLTATGLGQQPLRSGEPSMYSWYYTRVPGCAGCGLLATTTRPDGTVLSYTYDTLGNRTSSTVTPLGAGATPITTTWTWSTFAQFSRLLTHTSPRGNTVGATASDYTTKWSYNAAGDPTSVTYPKATINGSLASPSISCTFNPTGQILTHTDFGGTVTQYSYDPVTKQLTQIVRDFGTGRLNLTTSWTYDAYGHVASRTDPCGNTTNYTWNVLDQLVEVQPPQPLGGRIQYLYDNNGELYALNLENKDSAGTQDAANPGLTSTRDRNSDNVLTAIHVEVDATTLATLQFTHTAAGRLQTATGPIGDVTRWVYDERGLELTVTEGFGTSAAGTWQYDYDLAGYLSNLTNPGGFATTQTHDALGRLIVQTNSDGTSEVGTWDPDGNWTRLDSRDAAGVPRVRTERQYDPYGLLLAVNSVPMSPAGVPGTPAITTWTYGAELTRTTETDPTGATTTVLRDAVGRPLTVTGPQTDFVAYAYDACGQVVTMTTNDWNPLTQVFDVIVNETMYDALHRRVTTSRRDPGATLVAARSFQYDSRNNLVSSADELGNTERYSYDGLGRSAAVFRDLRVGGTGAGAVVSVVQTSTAYDAAGHVTSRTNGVGGVTSWTYDARGRMTTMTDAGGGVRTITYDAVSNIVGFTDVNGSSVTSTFDSMGRLLTRSVTRAQGVIGTTSEQFTYDSLGRLATALDDDTTVALTYDDFSRVATETGGPNPLGSSGRTYSLGYDLVGRATSLLHADGTVEQRSYDASGRPSSVVAQGTGTLAAYQWSGARPVRTTYLCGAVAAPSYDAIGRQTWSTATQGTSTLAQFEYRRDLAGRRLMEKRHHAGGTGDVYSYDSMDRTVQVKAGVSDPAAELATPGSQSIASTTTLSLTAAQGRASAAVTTASGTATTNYTADGVQFYTAVAGSTHVRDGNGNLVDDSLFTYEYDFENQLCRVSVKATGATVAEYSYDAFGRRVKRTAAGASASYDWSGTDVMAVRDAAGLVSRLHRGAEVDEIVYSHQRDVADLDGDQSVTDYVGLTPVYDGAFDCAAILGPSGAVAERYVHDFQGQLTVLDASGSPIATTALGWFQGYGRMWRDDATGLCYARARWYSPALGRSITSDPAGTWYDPSGLGNGYAWVGNSWRNGWDPSGLEEKKKCCGKESVITHVQSYDSGSASFRQCQRAIAEAAEAAGLTVTHSETAEDFKANVKAIKDEDKPCVTVAILSHGVAGQITLEDGWFSAPIMLTSQDMADLLGRSKDTKTGTWNTGNAIKNFLACGCQAKEGQWGSATGARVYALDDIHGLGDCSSLVDLLISQLPKPPKKEEKKQ